MPLDRDIYWVGRQWAVTGYGMQAVDQKQKSKFDIEASRIWDDDLVEALSAERWFNFEDFSEGLSIARARYPAPPRKAKPVSPSEMVFPPRSSSNSAEPANPDATKFAMRFAGPGAKFTSMWRVRINR